MRTFILSLFVAVVIAAGNMESFGQTLPFNIQQNYLSGVGIRPVFITNAKDGSRRLFLVEQGGVIKVYLPGSTTPSVFLNITSRVVSTSSEQGLLGLAFHPQYSSNRRFFVYYTRQADGAIQIAEYQASVADPNVADTTEKIIITIPHPTNTNHNGGTIAFGPDGYLYAGPGDGGSGNDPPNNAQNINVLLGKIIRIDINNVPVGQTPQYNIPPTNPYVGVTGADEIYAIGMRNPYRFSFDRGGTNQLWAADVGQSGAISWEEVDIITLGANYGWKVCEGFHLAGSATLCNNPAFTNPVFEYSSASPSQRCSITGGYVYRGGQRALLPGTYIYADYCTGEVLTWNGSQQTLMVDTNRNIVAFGEGEDGELYIVHAPFSGAAGAVDKILGNPLDPFDYELDGKADLSVYRPSNGSWWIQNSLNGTLNVREWGGGNDRITPADYDGDGKTDIAIFRPATGDWWVLSSQTLTLSVHNWGIGTDVIVPGEYGSDGKADFAIWRPSDGGWYLKGSDGTYSATAWGIATDRPVAADYDGDGKYDLSIFRPAEGNWWTINSTNGASTVKNFGIASDKLVPADYTGDGKADVAIWRPADGGWWVLDSTTGAATVRQWGIATDIPAPADYDGNGRTDLAVFRSNEGNWWIQYDNGSATVVNWGTNGDQPTPNAYVR